MDEPCGCDLANNAVVPERLAELFRHVADNLEALARWVGSATPEARLEHDAMRRVAAGYREIGEAAGRAAETMRAAGDLPAAPHDLARFDRGAFEAWMRRKSFSAVLRRCCSSTPKPPSASCAPWRPTIAGDGRTLRQTISASSCQQRSRGARWQQISRHLNADRRSTRVARHAAPRPTTPPGSSVRRQRGLQPRAGPPPAHLTALYRRRKPGPGPDPEPRAGRPLRLRDGPGRGPRPGAGVRGGRPGSREVVKLRRTLRRREAEVGDLHLLFLYL
jgi:hypothetical protein